MARMVILSCEVCNTIDSVENRVITANVCGHRVELCAEDRVKLLTLVNVSEAHARAYVARFDEQANTKGANPSLAQVLADLTEAEFPADMPEAGPETPVEQLVTPPPAEETEVEAAPRSKRR